MTDDRNENIDPNEESNPDKILFEKIKTLQKLPPEVVSAFLKSKGTLASSSFKNKLVQNAKQN